MKLTEQLRALALQQSNELADVLNQAADKLEDQRLWRDAWVKALKEIKQLTVDTSMLSSDQTERRNTEVS
jgi:Arc/MetJ-type ribon-helix-helix transcriptional regulator